MKKLSYLLILLATLSGCSKINFWEKDDVTPSQTELTFSSEAGELEVSIVSEADWYCEYEAEWLLVRQQQDKIRVIVDENLAEEQRTNIINLLVDGDIKSKITVKQLGTIVQVENNTFTVNSQGDAITIPIQSSMDWIVENLIDWCTIQKENNNLIISVLRNFQMSERVGTITINANDLYQTITITQSGCEWYESFEMVDVEAGVFYMGSQKDDPDGLNYDVSAYIITQAQWTAAMGCNPSTNQGDDFPVENVTWEQVQEFIALLNENSGLSYRLPTEAEWEFAAKGGNKSEGFLYSGNSVLGACGWYYSNSESATHEVGSKAPNELGIYDMSGNVREWCNDWLDYYSSNNENNPQGPVEGYVKVNRGGSWTTSSVNCRNTYRHSNYPYESSQDLGFRLAL